MGTGKGDGFGNWSGSGSWRDDDVGIGIGRDDDVGIGRALVFRVRWDGCDLRVSVFWSECGFLWSLGVRCSAFGSPLRDHGLGSPVSCLWLVWSMLVVGGLACRRRAVCGRSRWSSLVEGMGLWVFGGGWRVRLGLVRDCGREGGEGRGL